MYCTHCADGTTLAPLEGSFDEREGLSFTVRHLAPDGTLASETRARARLVDGKLVVSGTRGGPGGAFEHVAIKDPRGPTPSAFPVNIFPPGAPPVPIVAMSPGGGGGGGRPAPYEQPAPWRQLTRPTSSGSGSASGSAWTSSIS